MAEITQADIDELRQTIALNYHSLPIEWWRDNVYALLDALEAARKRIKAEPHYRACDGCGGAVCHHKDNPNRPCDRCGTTTGRPLLMAYIEQRGRFDAARKRVVEGEVDSAIVAELERLIADRDTQDAPGQHTGRCAELSQAEAIRLKRIIRRHRKAAEAAKEHADES